MEHPEVENPSEERTSSASQPPPAAPDWDGPGVVVTEDDGEID